MYGNIAGAFTQAFNASTRQEQQKRKEDRRFETAQQVAEVNMETSRLNNKMARHKLQQENSPEAKRLRVAEYKLKNRQIEMQTQNMDYLMSGKGAEQDAMEAKNQAVQTQKDLSNYVAVNKSINVARNVYEEYNITGKNTNFSAVNEWIKSDPVFGGMIKGDLVQFNPNNKEHIMALKDQAAKAVKNQGGDPQNADASFETLKSIAEDGMFMFDSQGGKMWDIMGIARAQGVEKELPNGIVDNVSKTILNKSKAVSTKKLAENEIDNDTPEWKKNKAGGGEDQPMTWTNPAGVKLDPIKALSAYESMPKMMGEPPLDLKEAAKFNAALGIPKDDKDVPSFFKGATEAQKIGWMDSTMEAVASGSATPEQISRLKEGVQTLKGEKMKERYMIGIKKAQNDLVISDTYKRGEFSDTDKQQLAKVEDYGMRNIYSTESFKKKRDQYNAKFETVSALNDAMDTLEGYLQPDENGKIPGIAHGAGVSVLLDWAAKDRESASKLSGMLDKAVKVVSGDGKVTYEFSGREFRRAMNMNSKIGFIVAKFVKDTSGAQVSDEERTFLMGLIAGAKAGDPVMMAEAMTTFRSTIGNEMKSKQSDLIERGTFPYTLSKLSEVDFKTDHVSNIEKGMGEYKNQKAGSVPSQNSAAAVKPVNEIDEETKKILTNIDWSK